MTEIEDDGAPALQKLNEAEQIMLQEETETETLKQEIIKEKKRLDDEIKQKDMECEKLKREVKELKKEVDHIEKLTSSSRDARKMYGDMTPGDTTHSDVTLAYQNHFKDAHRNMPKKLGQTEGDDKYRVWKKSADIVQECFDQNKERVVDTMAFKLEKALTEEHKTLTEETYDIQRAFKMLLEDTPGDELQAIIDEVSGEDDKKRNEAQKVIEVLQTLKPDDYLSFIKKGELRGRKASEIVLSH